MGKVGEESGVQARGHAVQAAAGTRMITAHAQIARRPRPAPPAHEPAPSLRTAHAGAARSRSAHCFAARRATQGSSRGFPHTTHKVLSMVRLQEDVALIAPPARELEPRGLTASKRTSFPWNTHCAAGSEMAKLVAHLPKDIV